jgi:hypothetical protein
MGRCKRYSTRPFSRASYDGLVKPGTGSRDCYEVKGGGRCVALRSRALGRRHPSSLWLWRSLAWQRLLWFDTPPPGPGPPGVQSRARLKCCWANRLSHFWLASFSSPSPPTVNTHLYHPLPPPIHPHSPLLGEVHNHSLSPLDSSRASSLFHLPYLTPPPLPPKNLQADILSLLHFRCRRAVLSLYLVDFARMTRCSFLLRLRGVCANLKSHQYLPSC